MDDKEARRLQAKQWRDKNPERYRKYQREYQRKRYHRHIVRSRAEARRDYRRRKKLGILHTPEQIEARRIKDHADYLAHADEYRAAARARYAAKILRLQGRIVRPSKKHK